MFVETMYFLYSIGVRSYFQQTLIYVPLVGQIYARHKFARLEDKFSLLLATTSLAPLTQTILPLHFAGFFVMMPLKILLISWPTGRPPAERRGVQGGDPPA